MKAQTCILLYGMPTAAEENWKTLLAQTDWQVRHCPALENLLWHLQEAHDFVVVVDLDQLDDVLPFLEVPCLLMSSRSERFEQLETNRLAIYDLFLKPFSQELLLFRLNRLLREARTQIPQDLNFTVDLLKSQTGQRQGSEASAVKRMLMQVGHDLKSPLFGFLAVGRRLLEHEPELHPKHRSLLSAAVRSLHSLSNQIDRMLDRERFQQDTFQISYREVDLFEVVEQVVIGLQVSASLKKVRIENQLSPGTLLSTDPLIATTVLQNLVQNALKYCAQGSRIEVKPCPLAPGSLLVADNGPGLEATRGREKAFEGPRSHGLGLSYCCELLSMLGGELQLVRSSEEGTVLRIRLEPMGTTKRMSQSTSWLDLPDFAKLN